MRKRAAQLCSIALACALGSAVAHADPVPAHPPGTGAGVQSKLAGADVLPTLAKAFSPSFVEAQKLTTLTITIGNATGSPYTLTAPFVDEMPVYVIVATTQAGTCAGVTTTGVDIKMAAGTVVPAGGCTIVVSVYALREGLYTNTTSVLATSAGNASPATAVLAVTLASPGLMKTFLPYTISAGGTALVAINVSNGNVGPPGTVYLTQPFVDTMPPVLTIRGGASGTCGAGVVGNSIVWTSGVINFGTCTIVVEVTALAAGTYVNTTGPLITNAGTAAPTSAALTVTGSLLFTASGGGSQQATVNTAYGAPLRATVATADGAPLAGIVVTFALPASGPSATFAGGGATAIATTDATGVATSPALTANGVAGSFSATATAAGVARAVQFPLTNAVSAPAIPVPAIGPMGLLVLAAGLGVAALRTRMRRRSTMQ